jgi:DNA replication and repair protein RecF
MLRRLDIHGIRNLNDISLTGLGQLCLITGVNGSGKTSVLESIYLLGMARSFRTSELRAIINHERQKFTVYGEVSESDGRSERRLGVSRSREGGIEIRIDGEPGEGRSALASILPVQTLHAESFQLIAGGPGQRRQFMDWGVFHVEHSFVSAWRRFQKAIKQRNALLRHGKMSDSMLLPWEQELAIAGHVIHQFRKEYLETLTPAYLGILAQLAPELDNPELRYRAGWDTKSMLADALAHNRSSDLKQGFTQVGPHRGDIKVVFGGRPAMEVLSRGQQKLVVCALKLAQGREFTKSTGRQCAYLVDDLQSELDSAHCRSVARELSEIGAQVFATAIEQSGLSSLWPCSMNMAHQMFHVEHGAITAI